MFLLDSRVIYSASDLAAAAECEFAFLRRLDEKLGWVSPTSSPDDPMGQRLAELGDAHEQRELQRLRETHGDYDPSTGRGVYRVERPQHSDAATLRAKHEETIDALRSGADVVFQACFFDSRFHGFADFLIKEIDADGAISYAVHDTKLAREAKVKALLQIAAYADQLTAAGIAVSERGHLLLGDGSLSSHRLADIVPVYRERRARLQQLVDHHQSAGVPVTWGDATVACGRCETCETAVVAHRDLLMVARMRTSQRKRLIGAGVHTIDDLAVLDHPVAGLPARSLETLRAQARLQLEADPGETIDAADPAVRFDVFDPARLGCLPPPDAGDIFFDFEGDPLWGGAGSAEIGLEYLFGVVETERPDELRAFWAHDRAAERVALEEFITYVMQRWRRHPRMHIYHYAPYEKAALLRLAGRHGVCEAEVDALLRAGVLVDLYAVVRESTRISQRSYSLKQLEPLYMGDDLRVGDVTTAGDSIISYHRYCGLRAEGHESEAEAELKEIAHYNHYDCVSTLRLRDWLLEQARRHGVDLGAATSDTVEGNDAVPDETDELVDRLADEAAAAPDAQRTPDQQALALLSAALGYHRREDKPFWWTYFDRLRSPIDEWVDTRGCFVPEQVSVVERWHKHGRQRKLRRHLRLVGRVETGSELEGGQAVHCIYDAPVPDGIDCPQGAVRGTSTSACVIGVDTDEDGSDVLVVEELLPDAAIEYDACPVAVCGPPGPRSDNLVAAIRELAEMTVSGLPALPSQPALDVLRRRPPRTRSGYLPPVGVGDDAYIDAITMATVDLVESYLAVQGPPGTGKTYTGARVIERLVHEHGWRIGVVAQSHSVVATMLDEVVDAGVDPERVAKKANGAGDRSWRSLKDTEHAGFLDQHADVGCVIGGTAWDFTNLNRIQRNQLDLLVVDEAGQFSLANTIAVSVSAQRLLLLGDPQQLPQVSQGRHPEPVDESALGWLAEGHDALPRDRGYFLERTWRMHPALCAPVSRMSYEGELHSQEGVTTARSIGGMSPGVQVVEVEHRANSVESPEEAAEVVAQVRRVLGRTWTDLRDSDSPRPLEQRDVLVVAPYNAQVSLIHRCLTAGGLGEVRVGTVDKFQGKQAPVVIVSMTASAIDDIPRGMSFLLSRNRVNVAVSRAKYATVIIRSAVLTNFLPSSPRGLAELGAFIGLCDSAARGWEDALTADVRNLTADAT